MCSLQHVCEFHDVHEMYDDVLCFAKMRYSCKQKKTIQSIAYCDKASSWRWFAYPDGGLIDAHLDDAHLVGSHFGNQLFGIDELVLSLIYSFVVDGKNRIQCPTKQPHYSENSDKISKFNSS